MPATTPECANIDHRQLGRAIGAGELRASIRALWELTPDLRVRIESVHRLSDLGAVVTHTASGTAKEGYVAEWRMIYLFAFEGDLLSRCEVFDAEDVKQAIARLGELDKSA